MYRHDDGTLKKEGDTMTSPTLAATLQKIANDPNEIISGSVAQDMVNDIQNDPSKCIQCSLNLNILLVIISYDVLIVWRMLDTR